MVENNVANELAKIIKRFRLKDIKHETPEENIKRQKEYEKRQVQKFYKNFDKTFLRKRSLYDEKNVLERVYSGLDINSPEQFKKLSKRSLGALNDFVNGNVYTEVLTGSSGTGKTTLAVCMLNKLSDEYTKRCLFVSASAMYDLAVSKYSDLPVQEKQRKQTRLHHLLEDIKAAEVVVIDDLGSETAMQSKAGEATQTMQDLLFRIGDMIQDKGLIITTNNTLSQFKQMYNPKVVSRLLTNNPEHVLNFNGIPDHRQKNR